MKVLVTGALGNVGVSVIDELWKNNHDVYIFEKKTKLNRKRAKRVKSHVKKIYYADIREKKSIKNALNECDCVVHLAAIVPPESERNLNLCESVNINGTKNLIDAILESKGSIPMVYVSSASVIGATQDMEPPVKTSTKALPRTFYDKTKLKAEELLLESGIKSCILRLASVLDSGADYSDDLLGLLFDLPLAARNEIILDTDAAYAIVSAAEIIASSDKINDKIYFISGGKKNGCQLTNRKLTESIFTAMGIGILSESCFTTDYSRYSYDWYDTEESNKILDYQKHSFNDYLNILLKRTQSGGRLVKYMAPKLKSAMELQSPYFKNTDKEK